MSGSRVGLALKQLSELFHGRRSSERSDGQLLDRFVRERDEAAFAALVQRHGNLVLGVCRRILGNTHDAEDAFQACFLVLIRSAPAIRHQESLASWLYGVARRTALKARTAAARRRAHERQAAMPATESSSSQPTWDDLRPLLDEELSQLPEHYRTPLILCYLEGKSKEEAARELDCPPGTVSSRLVRGRDLLRGRLARRGVTLSALGLVALLEQGTATAAVSAGLALATLQAALRLAAGEPAGVSASILTLTEGVLQTMLMSKIRMAVLAVVVPVLLLVCGVATYAALAQSDGTKADKGSTARAQNEQPSKPAASEAGQARAERLRKIIEEIRDAAAEEAALRYQSYEAGRGTIDILMGAYRRWISAERELTMEPKAWRVALIEYLDVMRKIEGLAKERFEVGKLNAAEVAHIRHFRCEAEQWLEEEKAK